MQPLFYAALAVAVGIAAAAGGPAALAPLGSPWTWCSLAAAAMVSSGWRGGRRAVALLALGFCGSAGYARARFVLTHPPAPTALERAVGELQPGPRDRVFLTGYLRDVPELLYEGGRPSAVRLDLEAVSLGRGAAASASWPVGGGVRLYGYPPRVAGHRSNSDEEDESDAAAPGDSSWANGLLRLDAGEGLAVEAHLRPPRAYHDPGVADVSASARREGIAFSATLPSGGWQPWPGVRGPQLEAARARLWAWLSRRVDRLAPPTAGRERSRVNGLLRGMLLGDVAGLDRATRTNFQIDGVYHLLVVAGLHVGILAAFLLVLLRWCRVPRLPAGALTLLLLAAYAWTIAGRTPTVRALFMLALYFGARLWYRERQALNAVGLAALVLLGWRPLDLFTPGFQMSLGAATLLAGVALPLLAATSRPLARASRRLEDAGVDEAFSPKLAQWRLDLRALATRLGWLWRPLGWRWMPRALRGALHVYDVAAISLVLQIGFAGFNAVYFHRANPWSVGANAVLVPAAGLLIPLAWAGVGIGGALGAGGARVARFFIGGLGTAMLRCADGMARWPGAGGRVPSPPAWFLVVFAFGIGVWLAAWMGPRSGGWRGGWRVIAMASVWAAALALVVAACPFPPRLPPGLSATVLDVGQGDSIFVSFPDGRTALVDGGPRSEHWDSGEEIVAPFLWSLGVRRLDAVFLTHGHNDHLGGLPAVVADFHPREVWLTKTLPTEAPVAAFLRQVEASGARIRRCSAGDSFLAGASRLEVLLPPPGYQAGEIASNDDSMVVRLSLGAESMLLEGDAEAGGERWMVEHHLPLASQLLKVGHHGSRTSSTPEFLAAAHPQAAVISVGAGNEYGHPAPEVVERLEQQGVRVFRTDRDGAVQCRLLADRLEVYLFPFAVGRAQ